MSTTETTLDSRLAALLASEPGALASARETWRAVRDHGEPYHFREALLVTRHADVKRVLRDLDDFGYVHVGLGRPVAEITAGYTPEQLDAFHEMAEFERNFINRSGDGETHTRLRRIAARAFTPRRVQEMQDAVQRATDDLLDQAVARGDGDLAPFAYTLPLLLVCDLLGVPEADRDRIHAWSGRLGRNRSGTEPGPLVDARAAMRELRAYVEAMLDEHRSARTALPPVVEALVGAGHEDRLSDVELTAMFVILLFAGHETTANLLGIGVVDLLARRDAWERLCADPDDAARATEELLRYVTPVQFLARMARRDTTLGGVDVPAGQYLVPVLAAANRDPDVFPEPDELRLDRVNAGDHLALGFGIHFCLGAALARMEGRIAFATLARRFPDLELAGDPASLPWLGHAMLRRLATVPVVLGPDRRRRACSAGIPPAGAGVHRCTRRGRG